MVPRSANVTQSGSYSVWSTSFEQISQWSCVLLLLLPYFLIVNLFLKLFRSSICFDSILEVLFVKLCFLHCHAFPFSSVFPFTRNGWDSADFKWTTRNIPTTIHCNAVKNLCYTRFILLLQKALHAVSTCLLNCGNVLDWEINTSILNKLLLQGTSFEFPIYIRQKRKIAQPKINIHISSRHDSHRLSRSLHRPYCHRCLLQSLPHCQSSCRCSRFPDKKR